MGLIETTIQIPISAGEWVIGVLRRKLTESNAQRKNGEMGVKKEENKRWVGWCCRVSGYNEEREQKREGGEGEKKREIAVKLKGRERESREMIEEGGGERAAGEEERERARFSLGKIIPHLLRKEVRYGADI